MAFTFAIIILITDAIFCFASVAIVATTYVPVGTTIAIIMAITATFRLPFTIITKWPAVRTMMALAPTRSYATFATFMAFAIAIFGITRTIGIVAIITLMALAKTIY